MTKADIVERIYEKAKASKKDASDVVDLVFELIKGRLEAGEKVKLSGFGNFVVNAKRPRKGRNPQTGEEIIISGRRVLSFKASQVLKNAINDGVRPSDGASPAAPGPSATTPADSPSISR
jgi:integration host factor subunit alpha